MTPFLSRRLYVQRVLDLYCLTPGTAGRPRRGDIQLARQLHDRGIPLEIVCAALTLAVARRILRSVDATPLAPIATLHYFRPVIDELIAEPPQPGYLAYIRHKLAPIAPEFAAAAGHQLP